METNRNQSQFPALTDVVPRQRIRMGVEYSYVLSTRYKELHSDGWTQVLGTDPLIIDDAVYLVMERGNGKYVTASYIPKVSVVR